MKPGITNVSKLFQKVLNKHAAEGPIFLTPTSDHAMSVLVVCRQPLHNLVNIILCCVSYMTLSFTAKYYRVVKDRNPIAVEY